VVVSKRGRILLADDEETFLRSTADLLREHGYACDCAKDSQVAISALAEEEYDLLISDINMPGNEQLEIFNEVNQKAYPLPIIVITGYPSVQTAVGTFRLSALDYLQKPLDIPEFITLVEKALKRERLLRTVRKTHEELKALVGTMESLEEIGRLPGRGEMNGHFASCLGAYLNQAVTHLVTVSTGLQTALGALKNGKEKLGERDLFEVLCPKCQKYREGLYQTVEVLIKTKGAFKSKDLGELRRKTEVLLKSLH